MLYRFIEAKLPEIQRLREQETKGKNTGYFACQRPDFAAALTMPGPSIIAEYKRASPSKGIINDSISPEIAAAEFHRAGASAFSVLTEEKFFGGSLSFLNHFAATGLPVLRKDFIFDPLQVEQTAQTTAAAVLLIVRVIKKISLLKKLVSLSFSLGLEPVVEIFSARELYLARQAEARTILVNNRDLDSLEIDLGLSRMLILEKKPDEIWICASGIDKSIQVREFYGLGFEAFLIGTSLMSTASPGEKLKELCA